MKKLLAIVLVLTLVISMSVSALATQDAAADAVIEWTAMDSANDGVFDPGSLPQDIQDIVDANGIPNFEALDAMEIDFGLRHIQTATAIFNTWAETDDGGPAGANPVPALLHNRAGALIISSDDWEVFIEIDDFIIGGGVNAGAVTMVGFELDLTPNALAGVSPVRPAGEVNVTGNAFAPQTITGLDVGASEMIAEGGIGFFGANWEGTLEVMAGTAVNSLGEEARAIMDWTFAYA